MFNVTVYYTDEDEAFELVEQFEDEMLARSFIEEQSDSWVVDLVVCPELNVQIEGAYHREAKKLKEKTCASIALSVGIV